MSRVRRGFKRRRRINKIFKQAKGFSFDRRTTYRQTVQTVLRAMHYTYKSRRLLKRDMRRLWIQRINAGAKTLDISYSRLINGLKIKNIEINRKMLADLAARNADVFKKVVEAAS